MISLPTLTLFTLISLHSLEAEVPFLTNLFKIGNFLKGRWFYGWPTLYKKGCDGSQSLAVTHKVFKMNSQRRDISEGHHVSYNVPDVTRQCVISHSKSIQLCCSLSEKGQETYQWIWFLKENFKNYATLHPIRTKLLAKSSGHFLIIHLYSRYPWASQRQRWLPLSLFKGSCEFHQTVLSWPLKPLTIPNFL